MTPEGFITSPVLDPTARCLTCMAFHEAYEVPATVTITHTASGETLACCADCSTSLAPRELAAYVHQMSLPFKLTENGTP